MTDTTEPTVTVEIKHWTGRVLFAAQVAVSIGERFRLKAALEIAVRSGARLVGASLDGASLDRASLVVRVARDQAGPEHGRGEVDVHARGRAQEAHFHGGEEQHAEVHGVDAQPPGNVGIFGEGRAANKDVHVADWM